MSNLGKTCFGFRYLITLKKCTHLSFCRRNIEKALEEFVLVAAVLQLEENQLEGGQAGGLDPRDDRILHPGGHCQVLNLWKVLQAPLLLQVGRAKKANLQVDWLCASRALQVQGETVLLAEVRQGKRGLGLNVLHIAIISISFYPPFLPLPVRACFKN